MKNLKEDFPIFAAKAKENEPFIYLDSAATTQKPQQVIDAVANFYTSSYATVNRAIYSSSRNVTEAYAAVREKVRKWVSAASDSEIVFTRGTTAGLNLLAISVNDLWIPKGGVVLVSEAEHHANVLSWEIACRRRGSLVKKIRVHDSGLIDLDDLEKLLNEGAQFVSIPHVSNVTGCVQPLQQVAELVHRYDAYLAVDGAQGAPHLPIDVQLWDVDFYVFSSHKIYGPTGIGVLYGKKDLLDQLPPVEGGGDMVAIYDHQNPEYLPAPMKFEAGTPNIAGVLGLGAALDYLDGLSAKFIYDKEIALTTYLHKELLEIPGVEILGPSIEEPRGALISMTIDGAHPLDLGFLLDLRGIAVRTGHQCAQPAMERWNVGHVLRVSLGIYNDEDDINQFILVLQDSLDKIRR
ncbi:cysteine desulfurase [Chlamydia pneumoniae LPCoLN]|uniref:cysteine desulfurase n=1 Tax=Chlamydia pneumoniae TaxID=83558 RepID=UPI0001BD9D90|nr:cysteine desulfurase [Chlamydia pneumoniae]ACZ32575.1 cysteine desulfurase [Chlamydia pneumoniae LPCoLN]